ncbi:MAG: TolC family protein [Deltaproteobacteria bacterium]|nr:TolC family protein [Deltaproteobacteria bacterium]
MAGLAVTFVAVCPVTTRADQRAAPASLDEATFIQRVLAASPRRTALDDRRAAARAQVGAAAQLPNPTVSYEREAVPGLDASDDFLRLGWTIDPSGRRGFAGAAARAGAEAERFTVERDAFVLEIEARLAYLEAVHARELVARLDAARVPLADLVETLRSRSRQGDTSSYDAERAALELDGLDDERATARRTLEVARLQLGALLGEPGSGYDATDVLGLPAKPAGPFGAPHRPDVDAALSRASQADRDLAGARRGWIPRLELVAGVMRSASAGGDGIGYIVGIGGDLPLFNAGGAAAERSRAEAKRWRSEAAALASEARGESEVSRRDLALRIEQAETYLTGPATRAADLQRRAAVAYREGDRTILELLDVQRSARHAAVRAVELIYEARRAELTMRRAQGRHR